MQIKLGYTTDDNRKLVKDVVWKSVLNCQIYGECSIISPTLIIHNAIQNFNNFNYCYIDAFDRYYFIKDIKLKDNNVIIETEIDVLNTYKSYIMNLNVTVVRNEMIGINEIKDDKLPLLNKKTVKCAIGDDTAFNVYDLEQGKNFILTANNGYNMQGG